LTCVIGDRFKCKKQGIGLPPLLLEHVCHPCAGTDCLASPLQPKLICIKNKHNVRKY
jgi:hypothetical protein